MDAQKKAIIDNWRDMKIREKLSKNGLESRLELLNKISNDEIKENFKMNLIALRIWNGLTVQEVMTILNIKNVKYFNWESGKTLPQHVDMMRICTLYGMTVEDMLLTRIDTESLFKE